MRILILEELILVRLKIVEHLDQSLSRILEIYILNIHIYVPYSRSNGWTEWAEYFWT